MSTNYQEVLMKTDVEFQPGAAGLGVDVDDVGEAVVFSAVVCAEEEAR